MATESEIQSDPTALAASSNAPNGQALECEDEPGSTAVADALKVDMIVCILSLFMKYVM